MLIFNRMGLRYPLHRTVIAVVFVLGDLTTANSYATSYKLQPLNDLSPYYQRSKLGQFDLYQPNTWVNIGGAFNYSMPYSSAPASQRNTGHYGGGIFGGQSFYLSQHNRIGYQLGFNANAKSSFAQFGVTNRQLNVSLYDVTALGQYQFAFNQAFTLGLSAGVGYVYGWVENNPAIGYYARFEPVLGIQSNWNISDHVAMNFSYLHYFGVASDRVYQSRQAAPSIDRIGIGVNYVF